LDTSDEVETALPNPLVPLTVANPSGPCECFRNWPISPSICLTWAINSDSRWRAYKQLYKHGNFAKGLFLALKSGIPTYGLQLNTLHFVLLLVPLHHLAHFCLQKALFPL
jgi:hypothetical protein